MEIPCEYIFTGPNELIERLEKCLDLTENPAIRKDSLSRQVKMSRRKEVEKGKQQLQCLQRIRNLDDKWQ